MQLQGSNHADKKEKYAYLSQGLKSLLIAETDLIANLSNFCAVLKQEFNWWWIGFYFVKNNQLVLGPFQGPVACTRINYGKGVCGTAWQNKAPIVVPNVHLFPGHIACSEASKSEIVLPIFFEEEVIAVLDIDSNQFDDFNEEDLEGLQNLLKLLPLNKQALNFYSQI
jgi:L-methionine (R)-S-oxide reductase